MQLEFDMSVAQGYTSKSQIARRVTENWVETQMFCPRCNNSEVKQFGNNNPVGDFYCPSCSYNGTQIPNHTLVILSCVWYNKRNLKLKGMV